MGEVPVLLGTTGLHLFGRCRYDSLVRQVTKCIDDALLWSSKYRRGLPPGYRVARHLCSQRDQDKFHFAEDEVEFANSEVKPCKKYLRASPCPCTAWFGLVNQVAFAFSMTSRMAPFRALLKPSAPFQWTNDLQQAFDDSKKEITARIKEGVQIFDKERPTCLATDWSKDGIGNWLFQKHCQPIPGDLLLPRGMEGENHRYSGPG